MALTIKYFGMLTEATNCNEELIEGSGFNVKELKSTLINLYPGLKNKSFKVAINHTLADDKTIISDDAEVALLPPFAGG